MPLYTPRRRRKPDINIVPLVDVLIVLIFFFLMTMQTHDQQTLDITPPKMDTAASGKPTDKLVINIDKAGKFFINNAEIPQDKLQNVIKAAAVKLGPSPNILIYADQDTAIKNITFAMDESRKLKFDKIRLQTR